jgi:bis(5'-nucleosyl)-tetraphosphatase (symmetrical)
MATYAIGDIQGCSHAFQALLRKLNFDIEQDKLWLVGDLINRGEGSLEVLRWCYAHQENIRIVLGNHDLHAVAVAHDVRPHHRSDTLQPLFNAIDGKSLLDWLRTQPLMIAEGDYVMVHAGLLPQWTIANALTYAKEVERALQSNDYMDFLNHMYGNQPNVWDDRLVGFDRLRLITNALTRMRVCTVQGELDLDFKGELNDIPENYYPWFEVTSRQSAGAEIICGHWSALGLYRENGIHALDTGCLWGGQLTAMCLETKAITQVDFDKRDKAERK